MVVVLLDEISWFGHYDNAFASEIVGVLRGFDSDAEPT